MPEEKGVPLEKNGAEIERLNQTFDVSSEKNRNLMFTFLAVQLYMFVAVSGTTDVSLLLPNSTFSLPIVSISIPLDAFYLLAPVLLLFLHFTVLINLTKHVPILSEWREESNNHKLQFPFIINQLDDSKGRREKILVQSVCNLIFVIAPLFLLVYFQFKYTSFHSVGISTFHCLIVGLDFFILFFYLNKIPNIFNVRFNREKLGASLLSIATAGAGFASLVLLVAFIFDWGGTKFLIIDVHEQELAKVKEEYKNIEITVDYKTTQPEFWQIYQPLDLKKRHLEGANLQAASLYKADLRNAHLAKANLASTQLQGANLQGIDLQNSNLQLANLEGAKLKDADLRGADLRWVKLKMANLQSADLRGANLQSAQLQGSNLEGINLQGVNLKDANLEGANLTGAALQGANLIRANLQGANFTSAIMHGANLESAELQGAILKETQLQGANLKSATLQGANLRWAYLHGANLKSANFQGAVLKEAELIGAALKLADLKGADLRKANLFATQNIYNRQKSYGLATATINGWNNSKQWDGLINQLKNVPEITGSKNIKAGIRRLEDAKKIATQTNHDNRIKLLNQKISTSTLKEQLNTLHTTRRALACTNQWIAKNLAATKASDKIYDEKLKHHIKTHRACRSHKIAAFVYP